MKVTGMRPRGRVLLFVLPGGLLTALLLASCIIGQAARPRSPPHLWRVIVGVESAGHATQGMALLPREVWINVGDPVL